MSESNYTTEGYNTGVFGRMSRDMSSLYMLMQLKKSIGALKDKNCTVVDFFEEAVAKHGDREALVFVGTSVRYTYADLDLESNRFANWGLEQGLTSGDVVAFSSSNRPELLTFILGMGKLGVCTSLVNPNLSGKPLEHAVTLSEAKHLVGTSETLSNLLLIKGDRRCWSLDSASNGATQLVASDDKPVDPSVRSGVSSVDTFLHIFTSGTTGLPKAAKVHHLKFLMAAASTKAFGLQDGDRIYSCLPLYHSAAMFLGAGGSWSVGGTLILRSKFSASNFWKDCCDYEATAAQYIGELASYLVSSPESEHETAHKVRVVYGNGMRKDVWTKFVDRFNVPTVGECYASTEGNATLFNTQNRIGAVGFIPPMIAKSFPVAILKFDIHTEAVVRDPATERCMRCPVGEPGELVGLIKMDDATRRFDGYTDKAATEKKILRDVFEEGDAWFRTGDLLRQDEEGFVYFVDRIGDTFRWKGENVSTAEVAEVLSTVQGVAEVNVYGVVVGAQDGRCGMVSLVRGEAWQEEDSLASLYAITADQLPAYSRPYFVRVQKEMDVTTTLKQRKVEVVAQGFDPDVVKDALFFRSASAGRYLPLTAELHKRIVSGEERL